MTHALLSAQDPHWASVAIDLDAILASCRADQCRIDNLKGSGNWYRSDSHLCCAVRQNGFVVAEATVVASPLTVFHGASANGVASAAGTPLLVTFPPGSASAYDAFRLGPVPAEDGNAFAGTLAAPGPTRLTFAPGTASATLRWAVDPTARSMWLRARVPCGVVATYPLRLVLAVGAVAAGDLVLERCNVSAAAERPVFVTGAAGSVVVTLGSAGPWPSVLDVLLLPLLSPSAFRPGVDPLSTTTMLPNSLRSTLLDCPTGHAVRNIFTEDTMQGHPMDTDPASRPGFQSIYVELRRTGPFIAVANMAGLYREPGIDPTVSFTLDTNFSTPTVLLVQQTTGTMLSVENRRISAACHLDTCPFNTTALVSVDPATGLWRFGQDLAGRPFLGEQSDGVECEWAVPCPAGTEALWLNVTHPTADTLTATDVVLPPSGAAPQLVPFTGAAPTATFTYDGRRVPHVFRLWPASWGYPGTPVTVEGIPGRPVVYHIDDKSSAGFAADARCTPRLQCSSGVAPAVAIAAGGTAVVTSDLDGAGPVPFLPADNCSWAVSCPVAHHVVLLAQSVDVGLAALSLPVAGAGGSLEAQTVAVGFEARSHTAPGFTLTFGCAVAPTPGPTTPEPSPGPSPAPTPVPATSSPTPAPHPTPGPSGPSGSSAAPPTPTAAMPSTASPTVTPTVAPTTPEAAPTPTLTEAPEPTPGPSSPAPSPAPPQPSAQSSSRASSSQAPSQGSDSQGSASHGSASHGSASQGSHHVASHGSSHGSTPAPPHGSSAHAASAPASSQASTAVPSRTLSMSVSTVRRPNPPHGAADDNGALSSTAVAAIAGAAVGLILLAAVAACVACWCLGVLCWRRRDEEGEEEEGGMRDVRTHTAAYTWQDKLQEVAQDINEGGHAEHRAAVEDAGLEEELLPRAPLQLQPPPAASLNSSGTSVPVDLSDL